MPIPQEILNQLGGNKFVAMTGATCFADGNTLILRFKGSKDANLLTITLNSLDLYDLSFYKVTGPNRILIKEVNGAYNDMLLQIFKRVTKLNVVL